MKDFNLYNGITNIINLRFKYLDKISDIDIILELPPLYQFILETPQLFDVTQKYIITDKNEYKQFITRENEIAEALKELKTRFITMFPEMDDSGYDNSNRTETERLLDSNYMSTFKRFDNLLNGIKIGLDSGTSVSPPSLYENQSVVKKALDILLGKKNAKIYELKEPLDEIGETLLSFGLELNYLNDRYEYIFKQFTNYQTTSPAVAFLWLENMINEINPQPQKITKLEDLFAIPKPYALRPLAYEPVRKAVYEGVSLDASFVKEVRHRLNQIYHGLTSGISQNLLYEQVVSKFKTRCMWYDKKRIRELLINSEGELIREKEDVLIKEMARYLFDNGFPVLFHIQTENLQTDLMDPSVKYPLLIEGKAYKDACKPNLLRGISQLHAYLNNFETTNYYIRDAYFVVFRIAGPIYDFPTEIITNRYRIIPILIDLGDSTVSGSRQENQPVLIRREEIIQDIEGS